MTKTLRDKKFRHIKEAEFEELPFDVEWSMNCPPYLAEEPPEEEILVEELDEEQDPLDRILDVFKNRKKDEQAERDRRRKGPVNVKPKRGESETERKRRERSEEIKRRNAKKKKKRNRKEKRKKFFDNLFKKKN